MIPLRLKLKDFLSYKEADLDLSQFGVVCLTGANGQGKSALLDAITWALFGAARGCEGGQNQDRLIRDGADRVLVDLEFDLGGQPWRIVRSRTKTGRADLQLMVAGGDGGWTNAAGESLRDTEVRIGELLRMDYKTFTASAFLLQGRADDFLSRMKPEERKDVFGRLLDLGTYEKLEDASRARARDLEGRRKSHALEVERLLPAEAEHTATCRDLDLATHEETAAATAAQEAAGNLQSSLDEVGRLDALLESVERERDGLAGVEARLAASRREAEDKQKDLNGVEALLARRAEVEAAVAAFDAASARASRLQEAADAVASLQAERREVAARAEAARAEAERQATDLQRRCAEMTRERDDLDAQAAQLDQMDALAAESRDVEATLADVRSTLETLREEHATVRADLAGAGERLAAVEERLETVSGAKGACPVCEGPLDAMHRKRLTSSITAERSAITASRTASESRLKDIEKEGQRLKEESERLAKVVEQRVGLLRKAEGLRAAVARRTGLAEQLAALDAELRALLQRLADGEVAGEWTARLTVLDEAIAARAYDREEHETVRRGIAELEPMRAMAGRLEEAGRSQERLRRDLQDIMARIEADEAEAKSRRAAIDSLTGALSGADHVRARAAEARERAEQAGRTLQEATAARARLSEREQRLRCDVDRLQEARQAEKALAGEHRVYARLSQAFGRGGIPDLIVENALPELTQEANDLLGRLTDYDMSVQFVMDKLTKSGKTKETFEVLVHHDGGVRDFAMFSGGEAFRTAFAIRLALSKLLVRRAGARLETLVIDEGFGTQDVEGRERLVEAINMARQEFARVIVITHLDELKDAFGAQISVSKHPVEGSIATVVTAHESA